MTWKNLTRSPQFLLRAAFLETLNGQSQVVTGG